MQFYAYLFTSQFSVISISNKNLSIDLFNIYDRPIIITVFINVCTANVYLGWPIEYIRVWVLGRVVFNDVVWFLKLHCIHT